MLTNHSGMRANLGRGKNKRRVYIDDHITGSPHTSQSLAQKNGGVRALPLRIGRRKQRANIGRGDGPEQSIGHRMQKDIAIGVTTEAFRMSQSDSPNLERNSSFEFVRIPAESDSHRWLFFFRLQI